jgi:hypothetical protein
MDSAAALEPGTGKPNPIKAGTEKAAAEAAQSARHPAGALEITEEGTRFITFPDVRLIAGAFAAGAMWGALVLSRRRK